MTSGPNHRFDRLLKAMLTKLALTSQPGAGTIATRGQASSAVPDEGSGDIQTPKGKSGATSSKPKRKSRT